MPEVSQCYFGVGLNQIWHFQIWLQPDMARVRNSNTTGAEFGKNLFRDHRTRCLMKLTASTMLTAAIRGSTVQRFRCRGCTIKSLTGHLCQQCLRASSLATCWTPRCQRLTASEIPAMCDSDVRIVFFHFESNRIVIVGLKSPVVSTC